MGRAAANGVRGGAPRGAVGSGGVRDPANGLSQQSKQAEGTQTGAGPRSHRDYRTGSAWQARQRGVAEANQWSNPPQDSTQLKPDGYGLPMRCAGACRFRGLPASGGDNFALPGVRDGCCVTVATWAAGEKLGADPADRAIVNVGTDPDRPVVGQSAVSADGPGSGWSLRSSRSRGKPGTWVRWRPCPRVHRASGPAGPSRPGRSSARSEDPPPRFAAGRSTASRAGQATEAGARRTTGAAPNQRVRGAKLLRRARINVRPDAVLIPEKLGAVEPQTRVTDARRVPWRTGRAYRLELVPPPRYRLMSPYLRLAAFLSSGRP